MGSISNRRGRDHHLVPLCPLSHEKELYLLPWYFLFCVRLFEGGILYPWLFSMSSSCVQSLVGVRNGIFFAWRPCHGSDIFVRLFQRSSLVWGISPKRDIISIEWWRTVIHMPTRVCVSQDLPLTGRVAAIKFPLTTYFIMHRPTFKMNCGIFFGRRREIVSGLKWGEEEAQSSVFSSRCSY